MKLREVLYFVQRHTLGRRCKQFELGQFISPTKTQVCPAQIPLPHQIFIEVEHIRGRKEHFKCKIRDFTGHILLL